MVNIQYTVITLEQTVALLQKSFEFVDLLLGSIFRASEYKSYASLNFPPLKAALPSSFFVASVFALCFGD